MRVICSRECLGSRPSRSSLLRLLQLVSGALSATSLCWKTQHSSLWNPLSPVSVSVNGVGRKEMFYLTTHSTHFIYGYMASDIWLRSILIVRKETRWRHIGYSYRLTARVLLYSSSHRQDSTYHNLCYTSRGALAGMRNSSLGPPHEGSIRRPITPWGKWRMHVVYSTTWYEWMNERMFNDTPAQK